MYFDWNKEKDKILQHKRGITFLEIVNALQHGKLVDIIENQSSNFDNQKCFLVDIDDYIWVIPFVENGEEIFLKTAFKSRKYQKIYKD